MPPRYVSLQSGCYYHIYNRGTNEQPIFFCQENWAYFIQQLRKYFKEDLVEIVAYCLMPTHYHLLTYLKTDRFSNQVMQPFSVAYAKAINRYKDREGPLFQGRFHAKPIMKQAYLLQLSRYIHLNPVQAGLINHPEEWIFSSYRDFIGLRNGTLPKPDIILSSFNSKQEYGVFVEEGIGESYEDIREFIIE